MICALNETTAFAVQDILARGQSNMWKCENDFKRNSPGPKPLCLAYIQPFVCVTVKKNEPTALNAKNLNALFWDIKIPNPTGQDNEWQMKE